MMMMGEHVNSKQLGSATVEPTCEIGRALCFFRAMWPTRISHLASRISHLASRISHLASRISYLVSMIIHISLILQHSTTCRVSQPNNVTSISPDSFAARNAPFQVCLMHTPCLQPRLRYSYLTHESLVWARRLG